MKLHHVPASAGWLWVRLGIRTFWRQPLALMGLSLMFVMAASLLALLPVVGALLIFVLTPGVWAGMLQATRTAHQGQFPMPNTLVAAFRGPREHAKAMLSLGSLYAVALVVTVLLTMVAFVVTNGDLDILHNAANLTVEQLENANIELGVLTYTVLFSALVLVFAQAAALAHWHGVSPAKSLFFSFMACWSNKGAIVMYYLAWMAVFLLAGLGLELLGHLLPTQVMATLTLPLAMLMSAMFLCSVFFVFRDSFSTDDGQAAG